MFWMPACLTALVLCDVVTGPRARAGAAKKAVWVGGLAGLALCWAVASGFARMSTQAPQNGADASLTGPQFRLMRWINAELKPQDGAVGLFWLGMAYDIPSFEVADFLGKGDELIARQPIKWGPPGHNKWDISKTLEKWRPQVIVPTIPAPSPAEMSGYQKHAQQKMTAKGDWAFVEDLVLNGQVQAQYVYCHVAPDDRWGLYVRRDVARHHAQRLRCQAG